MADDQLNKPPAGESADPARNENDAAAFDKQGKEMLSPLMHQEHRPSEEFRSALRDRLLEERRQRHMGKTKFNLADAMQRLSGLFRSRQLMAGLATLIIIAAVSMMLLAPHGQPGPQTVADLLISPAHAADGFVLEPLQPDTLGVPVDAAFKLTSAEPQDTATVEAHLSTEPAVDLEVTQVSETEWRVVPAEPLEPSEVLKVTLDATVASPDGSQEQREFHWAFQVKDSFKVLGSVPRPHSGGVPVDTGVEITFSHENVQDLDKHFAIEPKAEGRFEQHRRTLVFVPTAPLQPGTLYKVTVDKDLPLTGSDQRLAEDYVLSFETAPPPTSANLPWFYLAEDATLLTDDDPTIPVDMAEPPADGLDAKLFAFADVDAYLKARTERDRLPSWSETRRRYRVDTAGLNKMAEFKAPVVKLGTDDWSPKAIRLPMKPGAGFYVLELSIAGLERQMLMQVSPIAFYTDVTKNKTLVWVQDNRTGKPAGNAAVDLAGSRELGRTAADGTLAVDTPDELRPVRAPKEGQAQPYLKVTADGASLVAPVNNIYWWYDLNAKEWADADYWRYLYTDRPRYQRTDAIKFWGLLKRRADSAPEPNAVVTLYKEGYFDYYWRPVAITKEEVKTNANGIFEGEIKIDNLKPDYYTLELTVGDRIVSRNYIYVAAYTKPAYQIELNTDRHNLFAGEEAKLTATAKFFDGTPAPNVKLSFSDFDSLNTDLVTDAAGQAGLSYTFKPEQCQQELNGTCSWPAYRSIRVVPTSAEAGDIYADTGLTFYGPKTYVTWEQDYSQKGVAEFKFKARHLDLAALENSVIWAEDAEGREPAPGTPIEVIVTETTYVRNKTGESYDFINKVVVPLYTYDRVDTKQPPVTVTADAQGQAVFRLNTRENASYSLFFRWTDENGRSSYREAWAWYYDGFMTWQSMDDTGTYFNLESDKPYGIGDEVKAKFVRGHEPLPPAEGRYLFLKHQNGLRAWQVSGTSEYSFTFAQADVPNVVLNAVTWNGHYFVSGSAYVQYRNADKELKVKVTTDKEQYKPGEQVKLSAEVTDKDGQPVTGDLNLNLVDEAFYAVANDYASPLGSIYGDIGDGVLYAVTSIEAPMASRGAEKGGCFAAGTPVILADGSEKPIERVSAGEQVLTLTDPLSQAKTAGAVVRTYSHVVKELLEVNGRMLVTPEHRVYANRAFRQAGELQLGDRLLDADGRLVPITSLKRLTGTFQVYNLEVAPQHTFFAAGFYVHNEKGGGPREFFTDTAVFTNMAIGPDGRGTAEFKLPDNLTSWRITAQAVSSDLGVGLSVTKIPVSLPAFVEMSVAKSYLAGDQPVVRLRSFGSGLTADMPVTLSLAAASLGLTVPEKRETKAFAAERFQLPPLPAGRHDLIASLESPAGKDSMKLTVEALQSRLLKEDRFFNQTVTPGMILPAEGRLEVRVILADEDRDDLYLPLTQLAAAWGSRVDQMVVRHEAALALNKSFGEELWITDYDTSNYLAGDGGVSLLPYSSTELPLSAKIAAWFPERFDGTAMASYFNARQSDSNSSAEEISYSLWGLAALGQPVLTSLEVWSGYEKLSPMDKLVVAAAWASAGDGEKARNQLAELLKTSGETKGNGLVYKVDGDDNDLAAATALAAWLAASLDMPEHEKLWDGLSQLKHPDEPLFLEQWAYIRTILSRRVARPASVSYVLNGDKRTARLSGGQVESFVFRPTADTLSFEAVTGSVSVSMTAPRAAAESELRLSDAVQVSREYRVNGQPTTTFKDSDIIEVMLYPTVNAAAPQEGSGAYEVRDLLPAGLAPVASTRGYDPSYSNDCFAYWPTSIDEEEGVSFMIYREAWPEQCKFLRYFARVRSAGTFAAEPAMIQSYDHPEIVNASDKTTVTIQ